MAMITLQLIQGSSITLEGIRYSNPSSGVRYDCIRGRTAGAFRGYGTFTWTSAVQSATLLLVRAALWARLENGDMTAIPVLLSGGAGSSASSLDMAISARTVWLYDMFGADPRGTPLAARIFPRTNPNRKRPGPVSIGLNPAFIAPEQIEIVVNGKVLMVAEDLRRIEAQLAKSMGEGEIFGPLIQKLAA